MAKKWLLAIPVILGVGYFAGPSPKTPEYKNDMPAVPAQAIALQQYIQQKETAHKIKPDNEARIIWNNDSSKTKTQYAIVYLHGFSASQFEGAPAHTNLAKMFGCNLYLARMAEHGIDTTDALANLTADGYWASAKEALAIAKQLGNKVILMGTSTGGTNALQLAAAYPNNVAALILYSPNIAINDKNAWVLNNPWGLQIARRVTGGNYRQSTDERPTYKQYWNWRYRLEGTVALEELIETSINKATFEKVKQPVLLLYYYKDEQHQDPVVKVSAMKEMFEALGTLPDKKRQKAMPNTGDHVIASPLKSSDAMGVQNETEKFLKEVMGMKAVQ
jgi:pimeloyl-ACP methyl ester carboxylesterase